MNHIEQFFKESATLCGRINKNTINSLVHELIDLRTRRGRLFVLGCGGSAANASHFVNDLRKLCQIECYAPTDNIAEITARTNDEGWQTVFAEYLKISNLGLNDAILVLSVGGGAEGVSENLIEAIKYSKEVKAKVFGIVGRSNGYTAKSADLCIIVPNINSNHITPHSESMQVVILHSLVSHPYLKVSKTKW